MVAHQQFAHSHDTQVGWMRGKHGETKDGEAGPIFG
jgi:hypothetical protein